VARYGKVSVRYGKAIRVLRAARGLSQKDVAAHTGLDPSYISLLESGERRPAARTVGSLARAFRVPEGLLTFLAAEKHELRGIPSAKAGRLRRELLAVLLAAEKSVGPQ
jgi:transcriptional regulator with XRE-family HTH domain